MNQPLSPAAQAVLAAITQQQYSLDPDDIPNEAGRMACIAAAALRAAADQVVPEDYPQFSESYGYSEAVVFNDGKRCANEDARDALLAIAAELEGQQ